MDRKEAIEELDHCLEANEFPAWEAIAIAHKNLKLVEEVVGWLEDSIKSTSSTPGQVSFIDGRIDAWEDILEMLTEGE